MRVVDDLTINADHTATLVGAEAHRLQGKLHIEHAISSEIGLADMLGALNRSEHAIAQQRAPFSIDQILGSFFDKRTQVVVIETIKNATGGEEGLEVAQRYLARGAGCQRIATRQALLIGCHHLIEPLMFEVANGAGHQQLPALISQAFQHAVHRSRSMLGNALEVVDGVAATQCQTVTRRDKRGPPRVVGALYLAQVVTQLADGCLDFGNVSRIVTAGIKQTVEVAEITLDLSGQAIAR